FKSRPINDTLGIEDNNIRFHTLPKPPAIRQSQTGCRSSSHLAYRFFQTEPLFFSHEWAEHPCKRPGSSRMSTTGLSIACDHHPRLSIKSLYVRFLHRSANHAGATIFDNSHV